MAVDVQAAEIEAALAEGGVWEALRRRFESLKSGDVGSLPVIVGLAIITVFFWWKNHNFVTAVNFDNLIVQMAAVTAIAIGVVFVLLVGEIDLSIGYVSGVAGVVVAELQQPGKSYQVTGILAILIAVATGAAIGAFQGSFVALIGIPSFVVTLAGLLAWQGVILKVIGIQGVIGIQDHTVNDTANYFIPNGIGWILAGVAAVLYAATTLSGMLARRRAGIATGPIWWTAVKIVLFAGVCFFVVGVANHDRGFPLAGLLIVSLLVFWTYVAKRTTFGRHVYAVGGNAEAARRAGINVARIRIYCFMISGAMAGLGGVIFAARLSSVDLNAGGGTILLDAISAAVIGGTSLFGGRGDVKSALLGALIIQSIANGLGLIGSPDSTKYIMTGVILLAAVTLDTVAKRRLEAAGR
jgi:D-xylose transport system permease protein